MQINAHLLFKSPFGLICCLSDVESCTVMPAEDITTTWKVQVCVEPVVIIEPGSGNNDDTESSGNSAGCYYEMLLISEKRTV